MYKPTCMKTQYVEYRTHAVIVQDWLHCVLAAAQCIVIGPVCLFVGVGVCVCLLPRELEIACIDPHQTGFVGKGSDRLQLIKFWPSRTPGKEVCSGAKFLALLLQPARSVCVYSERFFHCFFSIPMCGVFHTLDIYYFAAYCYCATLCSSVHYLII